MAYFAFSARLRPFGLCAVAVGLIALSITGCVRLLEPRTGDATYYLLSDGARIQNAQPADTTGLAVGLREPGLASYLAATRIVTRRGPHQIHFSEFHRWGEDLERGISRTVALALAEQTGIQPVEIVPWPKGATFDYIVQLHVLSFEGIGPPPDPEADENAPPPDGHSRMVVEWTILDAEGDTVLARGLTRRQEEDWQVGDYEALASNLGTGLTVLAKDIGMRLRTKP